MARVTGMVKFFHPVKCYGFICPDDNSEEVFVHLSDLGRSCAQLGDGSPRVTLYMGQRVSYELAASTTGKGNGKKASRVELVQ